MALPSPSRLISAVEPPGPRCSAEITDLLNSSSESSKVDGLALSRSRVLADRDEEAAPFSGAAAALGGASVAPRPSEPSEGSSDSSGGGGAAAVSQQGGLLPAGGGCLEGGLLPARNVRLPLVFSPNASSPASVPPSAPPHAPPHAPSARPAGTVKPAAEPASDLARGLQSQHRGPYSASGWAPIAASARQSPPSPPARRNARPESPPPRSPSRRTASAPPSPGRPSSFSATEGRPGSFSGFEREHVALSRRCPSPPPPGPGPGPLEVAEGTAAPTSGTPVASRGPGQSGASAAGKCRHRAVNTPCMRRARSMPKHHVQAPCMHTRRERGRLMPSPVICDAIANAIVGDGISVLHGGGVERTPSAEAAAAVASASGGARVAAGAEATLPGLIALHISPPQIELADVPNALKPTGCGGQAVYLPWAPPGDDTEEGTVKGGCAQQ